MADKIYKLSVDDILEAFEEGRRDTIREMNSELPTKYNTCPRIRRKKVSGLNDKVC